MNYSNNLSIARAWISHTRRHIGVKSISYNDEAAELDRLCVTSPEVAWDIIVNIIDTFPEFSFSENSDNENEIQSILANLAAGPVEDLLVYNGKAVIGHVEARAASDVRLRFVLGCVWRNDIEDGVWERIQRIVIR